MQTLRSRRVVAATMVTVLSVVIIGVVLVAATPIGCGPARAMGLKTIGGQCGKPVAVTTSPNPTPSSTQRPTATPSGFVSPSPVPSASEQPQPSPTVFPTTAPPDTGPASGSYPPFYPAATGSGGTAQPALSLNCRLPVFAGPPGSGGFIVFPGGAFIADPTSAVSLPSPSPGEPSPQPQGGYGYGPGLTYDAAYSKWLPVGASQVSPDGSRYAFVSPDSIYVEDVAHGTLSEIGQGQSWTVISVQAAGVYAGQPGKPGLWLVPYTGAPRQVTPGGFWSVAGADFAYGTPTSAVPQGATNVIIRVDLKSGATVNWFTRQDTQSNVVGLDSHGAAIIFVAYFVQPGGSEVWISTGPGTAVPIMGSGTGVNLYGTPVADSHGIWFPGSTNVSYQPTGGFALYVAGQGTYWMSNFSAQLAGGCVQP